MYLSPVRGTSQFNLYCSDMSIVPGRGRTELKDMFLIYNSSRQMQSNTVNNAKDNQLQYFVVLGCLKMYGVLF